VSTEEEMAYALLINWGPLTERILFEGHEWKLEVRAGAPGASQTVFTVRYDGPYFLPTPGLVHCSKFAMLATDGTETLRCALTPEAGSRLGWRVHQAAQLAVLASTVRANWRDSLDAPVGPALTLRWDATQKDVEEAEAKLSALARKGRPALRALLGRRGKEGSLRDIDIDDACDRPKAVLSVLEEVHADFLGRRVAAVKMALDHVGLIRWIQRSA